MPSIFNRSLFKILADEAISQITEKREVSSTKNLEFEDNTVNKSLIQIKNNKGPRIGPLGSPAFTAVQLETCPFKTTLW